MSLAVLSVHATPGAELVELSVYAGSADVRLVRPWESVLVAHCSVIQTYARRVHEAVIEFDPASGMAGSVVERRPDGSLWERSLFEGDWVDGRF